MWVTIGGYVLAAVAALAGVWLTQRAESRRTAAIHALERHRREADAIAGFLAASQSVGMQWSGYLGLLYRAESTAAIQDAEDRCVPGINQAMLDLTSALAQVETSVRSPQLVGLASRVEVRGYDIVAAMERYILAMTKQNLDWIAERWSEFNQERRGFVDAARAAVFPMESAVKRTPYTFLTGGGVDAHRGRPAQRTHTAG